jgi:hypothetical protein
MPACRRPPLLDYSDVTVSSPYGVIPWPKVSCLNDDEMKQLMVDVVNRGLPLYPHVAR